VKNLLIVSFVFLGMCSAAFGTTLTSSPFGDLTMLLDPTVEVYPPGEDPSICEETVVAPCVVFSGTLTDNDTDGSVMNLNGVSVNFSGGDSAYFTVDPNFFDYNLPCCLSGDPNWATDGNPFSNTYTGPIFALDIAPGTPVNVYTETLVLSASGGTNDPNGNGFTVQEDFTIVIAPEPASGLLLAMGLVAIAASRRVVLRSRRTRGR
jgi:hypothetical protein